MKKEVADLVEKYKDIPGMQHPSCSDGWYDILDELLGKIHDYLSVPKEPTEDNKNLHEFSISQIKEKFGTLNFYADGYNKYIIDLIREAEKKSRTTCELCGSTENIGTTNGWITTCCQSCYQNNERTSKRIWTPIK